MKEPRVINIGVTGHRVLRDVDGICIAVDEALRRIEQAYSSESIMVISALAEGADRIVAQRALLRPGAALTAVLPMPESEYLQDFTTQESQSEFKRLLAQANRVVVIPPAKSRDEAYQAGGYYVLDHSDALIAIWDGLAPRGRGGTGEIVEAARKRCLPLAWIRVANSRPAGSEYEL